MAERSAPVGIATVRLDTSTNRFRARLIAQPDIRADPQSGQESSDPRYFFSPDEVLQAVREFIDSYLEVAKTPGDHQDVDEAPD